ncbi:hypothetical protein LCGC14_2189030, partial [marine sediment metagenome]
NRIGLRPNLFVIDRDEALDIDEESDFRLAEYLLKDNNTDFDFVKAPFNSYTTTQFQVRLTRADGDAQEDDKLLTFMAIGPA